jgi:hypothetical protein
MLYNLITKNRVFIVADSHKTAMQISEDLHIDWRTLNVWFITPSSAQRLHGIRAKDTDVLVIGGQFDSIKDVHLISDILTSCGFSHTLNEK